ncbi:MAG TPA: LuxR C-terminal-related transcriptional regulator [Pseudonocardiaceae bacterium]|nr:LuxR C-terminal-related transcriptional regulator [Pseudonocardiaceae bacterium]
MTGVGAHLADRQGNRQRDWHTDRLALSGAARRLLTDVRTDPRAGLVAGVTGPGGTGKSGLLDALTQAYDQAGLTVHHGLPDGPPSADAVVLLDDAHLLDEVRLTDLTTLAGRPGARLVVAYRPWPLRPALSTLARSRPEVRLGHLDRSEVAALLPGASPDLLDEVCARTGGSPALVELAAAGLRAGRTDPVGAGLDRVGGELDRLPPLVRGLLLALAVGAEASARSLAELLATDLAAATDALDCAWSVGLLADTGEVIGLVAQAVTRSTSGIAQRETKRRLAELQLDHGGPLLPTGRLLLDVGARGPRAAAALEAAGDEALTDSAALATDLFAGAVAAGASPVRLAARRAEAAALTGDLDGALRLADRALADTAVSDRARAASVAATVLAHRGMLGDSATLSLSADTAARAATGAAVTALLGVGELDAAERELSVLDSARTDTPALVASVGSLIAHGVHHTVSGAELVGLSELVQAARLLGERANTTLLPDAPAALAALVAIHLGEPDVAARMVDRALTSQPAGAIDVTRCRLLNGWIALLRGELATVETTLAQLTGLLEPRDELYAAALAVGLARRRTDLPGLMAAWPQAREALLAHPVDLYVLQPLGEIAVAAAKLHEDHLLAGHLSQAEAMLDRLGRPPLWSGPLHWYGLHAAIAAESPAAAVRHARSMTAMASRGRCAAALARAGGSWLRVLAGDVDVAAVTGAARDIQAIGLVWDGARLAGQAAIRTTDRKAMATLLSFARALQEGPPADAAPAAAQSGEVTLSSRELEVAALLVDGMTYKQIGERLFISAKTVEHHIARIRHRLGDPARREMVARLRMMVGATAV